MKKWGICKNYCQNNALKRLYALNHNFGLHLCFSDSFPQFCSFHKDLLKCHLLINWQLIGKYEKLFKSSSNQMNAICFNFYIKKCDIKVLSRNIFKKYLRTLEITSFWLSTILNDSQIQTINLMRISYWKESNYSVLSYLVIIFINDS
jgi:hypothetical protein